MADLHQADVGIEIAEQVVGFLENGAVFVAHAEVESQILGGAPVILHKSRMPSCGGAAWDRRLPPTLEGHAGEEIFERVRLGTGPVRLTTPPRKVMLPRALPYAPPVTSS